MSAPHGPEQGGYGPDDYDPRRTRPSGTVYGSGGPEQTYGRAHGSAQPYGHAQPYGQSQTYGRPQPYEDTPHPYVQAQPYSPAQPYVQAPPYSPAQPYGQTPPNHAYGAPVPHYPSPPRPPTYGGMAGPGGHGAPPPKKKSSVGKVALFVVVGFVAMCVGFGIFGAANSDESGTDTAAAPSQAAKQDAKQDAGSKPETAGLNTPVRDGKFEFTVKSVKCGETKVGSEYLNETAQGQFCLVAISVQNIGDEAQAIASSAQLAYNAEGQEFKPNDAASLYVNDDQQVLYNEINPGNSMNATLVWDIPKGQKITKLELHDSLFSGGVEVSVA